MDYEKLYAIWLKEIENKSLQGLPPRFYEELSRYINTLRKGLNNENLGRIESKIIESELKNAQFMIKDLCILRLEKILKSILRKDETVEVQLNPVEKKYFKPLIDSLKNYFMFISNILEGKIIGEIEKELRSIKIDEFKKEKIAVRILENLPAIVGTDMKVYGPFKKGDIVVLPSKNVETLIKRNKAKIIKV